MDLIFLLIGFRDILERINIYGIFLLVFMYVIPNLKIKNFQFFI